VLSSATEESSQVLQHRSSNKKSCNIAAAPKSLGISQQQQKVLQYRSSNKKSWNMAAATKTQIVGFAFSFLKI